MGTSRTSGKQIAKNTVMLYVRMLVLMGVNLFATRIVLHALGDDNYGLYTLVGGVASFLAFINTSMAAASMRFQSYEKGLPVEKRNEDGIFSSILIVQIFLAIIILICGEMLGIWYIDRYLNAPASSIPAAHIVFQFALFQFICKTLSTPYTSSILANERMDIFAYISLLEGFLQLTAAYMINWIPGNALTNYAILMFVATGFSQLAYIVVTRKLFYECHFSSEWTWSAIKQILMYSCWNLLGTFSSVCIGIGVNMVLNFFFGLVVNAARGIALQVNSAVTSLATNFQQALNPQIVKSYAAQNTPRLNALIINGTRLCFFMMAIVAVPCAAFMPGLLDMWLTDVPNYTVGFCRLIIIASMFTPLSGCLLATAMATTSIRKYQLIVAGINLLNIPATIVVLKIYPNPYVAMYIMILLAAVAMLARIVITRSMVKYDVKAYLLQGVLSPVLWISIFSFLLGLLIKLIPLTTLTSVVGVALTIPMEGLFIYMFCMNQSERDMMRNVVYSRLHRQ